MKKESERLKKCIACGAELYKEPLLKLKNMPASAQGLPGRDELDGERGTDIDLCECTGCGLVQLDSDPVSYYKDVIRSGGYTSTMEDLRREQYRTFINTFGLTGKKIIEVGCGQGEFLKTLAEFDVKPYGMEHKKELAERAAALGLDVYEHYPEGEDDRFKDAPYDAFTSFNFLEHQPDPYMYLRCIHHNLTEEGCGLITVPSLEYIIDKKTYYEIIPDHIAYYTEESLRKLLERCGFDVVSCETVNRDTISCLVKKTKRIDLSSVIDAHDDIVSQMQSAAKDAGKLAIWGASHQGFTILSTCELDAYVDFIIDSAPFKQGRFSPASHIPIISPDDAVKEDPDTIIIIAPGYSDEIAGIIRERFKEGTEVYTLKTDKLERL